MLNLVNSLRNERLSLTDIAYSAVKILKINGNVLESLAIKYYEKETSLQEKRDLRTRLWKEFDETDGLESHRKRLFIALLEDKTGEPDRDLEYMFQVLTLMNIDQQTIKRIIQASLN